jgi:hypothetical protein
MKKSSIKGGGFGVFALHDVFSKEFITVYLGEKIKVYLHVQRHHKFTQDINKLWFPRRILVRS